MFYVGMDLGKRQAYTAIAVVQRREQYRGQGLPTFAGVAVRHVERVALGTPYPRVVERVKQIVQSDALAGNCYLTVDATGVGNPVVDMLKDARLGCQVCAVTITSGEKADQHATGWNVPKQDLIAGVQLLLEDEKLRIAGNLDGSRMLMRDLMICRRGKGEGAESEWGRNGRGSMTIW